MTLFHTHCYDSQYNREENDGAEECNSDHSSIFLMFEFFIIVFVNLYFSQCKDRMIISRMQVFSTNFDHDMATPWPNGDNNAETLSILSLRRKKKSLPKVNLNGE